MKDMETEIDKLQKEKDDICRILESVKANAVNNKYDCCCVCYPVVYSWSRSNIFSSVFKRDNFCCCALEFLLVFSNGFWLF